MQIGNAAMDDVHDNAIAPAISDAGLAARRVDRHNEGDLLKSEIVLFIERSQIIVADLTNERPNCYLEVGYAMGLGKKANLILTARSDHHWSNPDSSATGHACTLTSRATTSCSGIPTTWTASGRH